MVELSQAVAHSVLAVGSRQIFGVDVLSPTPSVWLNQAVRGTLTDGICSYLNVEADFFIPCAIPLLRGSEVTLLERWP